MDHKFDDNVNNVLNIEEEADITSIDSINWTNDIYIKNYENYMNKYCATFLSSNNHENVSYVSEYDLAKQRVCHKKHYFGFTIK